jgi:hemoglobin
MKPKLQLIEGREQIITLVDIFYHKVRSDSFIGPIFDVEAQVSWDEHIEKLYNFWEDLLFGTQKYHGRPFPKHTQFDLKIEHFERWLKLFDEAVDENFTGLKANEAKEMAHRIGDNFLQNLKRISDASKN